MCANISIAGEAIDKGVGHTQPNAEPLNKGNMESSIIFLFFFIICVFVSTLISWRKKT